MNFPYLNRNSFHYCMHACGFIHELMFTNSLEAMEYWYTQGVRMFEIDIDSTEDGEYVACHNFTEETFRKMDIEDIPKHCTYEWFQRQKLYKGITGGLTPMGLVDIFDMLRKRAECMVMIDPKVYSYAGCCALLDKLKYYIDKSSIDGKRIVFEAYNEDMILAIKEYKGMMQNQYCIDDEMQMGTSEKMRKWPLDNTIEFLKKNDIWIISYPWKFAVENLEKLKTLKQEGFFVFSKKRNDIFSDLLRQSGVNVNIIDYLVTDAQREELQGYKEEYYKTYKNEIDKVFAEEVQIH